MTRLPDLERQLLEAARTLDAKPRRWWRISLLGGGATLALAATAVGAVRLLLPEGDPVPKAPPAQRASLPELDPGTARLISLRADDPDGGPPWGLAIARSKDGDLFCAQVGRVQGGRLGVIGRDGTFNNDGRFHPLSADANQGSVCGGSLPDGDLQLSKDGPPIPASGFTGSFLSAAGGCRERVADPKATMSPQTRRKLRHVPVCKASSLRVVKYGFAGRDAVKIDYAGKTVRPNPDESGAYLFVLKPRKRPLSMRITYKDGTVCRTTYPTRDRPTPCAPDDSPPAPGGRGSGRSISRSPVPPEQARAFAVLRRPPTEEDRSPVVNELLRRSTLTLFGSGVRVESVRLLRRRPGAVTILVPIERLRGQPDVRDALCVLKEHEGGGLPHMTCGSFPDILAGRARTTLPPAGLVPDGAITVRIRVTGGKTIDAPVDDNYYDLSRPEGEQYAGIAPPRLLDKNGHELRPTVEQFGR